MITAAAEGEAPSAGGPALAEKSGSWRPLLLLVLIVGTVLVSAVWKARDRPLRAPLPGEPAPSFVLDDLGGHPQRLLDWRGHPVLLTFWAPWSPPGCAQVRLTTSGTLSLPSDWVVVDVALDYVDTPQVNRIVGKRGVHLLGRPTELMPWGDFPTLPRTFLIDRGGNVQRVWKGFQDRAELEGAAR
jgi:hypothetical protein